MPRGRTHWTQLFAALLGWIGSLGLTVVSAAKLEFPQTLERVVFGALAVPYWISCSFLRFRIPLLNHDEHSCST